MSMNEEIKVRWVEALESGRFVQAKGSLRKKLGSGGYGHCCLGVLCELALEAGLLVRGRRETYVSRAADGEVASIVLPRVVMEWAGLEQCNPYVSENTTLADLNDRGESFRYIAREIKEKL